ncbi:methyltransferase domain-containing protein [Streptomyces sp. NBC_00487]|uniref:class I SAM-dependent methyltransferase n=1 Tax=unclassified Streptomyces TaxID=2593676 RepID=UPI002DDAC7AF|nr:MULTISPECIES: class I SAM-dependent methyltransferase [unclassified Streptomyces]WRZ01104.1 methyltransferase domain-containing protein [Streptomyces sp. NBC_00481]
MADPGHVRTFNRIAPRYDAKFGKDCVAAHDLVLGWAQQARLAPDTVLDIGCGTGQLLSAAAERWPGARLHGVDPAEAMLAIAGKRLPAASLHAGRAERLPLPDGGVDLVLSTTSFGHWTDAEAGLREVRRVLRPGGSVLIAEHAPPGALLTVVLKALGRLPRLYGAEEMRALVRRAGLCPRRAETHPGVFVVTHAVRPV